MISSGKPQGHGWARHFAPPRGALDQLYRAAARRRAQERQRFAKLCAKPPMPMKRGPWGRTN
jgi:hypothetical protein